MDGEQYTITKESRKDYEDIIRKSNCPELAARIVDFRTNRIPLSKTGEKELLLDKNWNEYKWVLPPRDGYVILFAFQSDNFHSGDAVPGGEMRSYSFFPTAEQAAYNNYMDATVVIAPVDSVMLHDDNGQGNHPISFEEQRVLLSVPEQELGSPSLIMEKTDAIYDPTVKDLLEKNWSGPYFLGPFKKCPVYLPLGQWIETLGDSSTSI
ncbi:hypothetical protein HY407_00730 [Candidatus Gottesmanbacteria bacterium]|nr:hypothetical protein [Candidatus Gottesmanbacteria bacterium]